MIEIINLNKIFYENTNKEFKALKNINLNIKKSSCIVLKGPSGSGKSSLLSIIAAMQKPTNGEVLINKQNIVKLPDFHSSSFRARNIGFIFQNFNLIDELSVKDNIELPLIYNGMKASERKKRIDEITMRLGIGHRLHHFPQQLSGGQQQRVAVARALINDPKIILADEPTGNLDSRSGNEVMELLTDLHVHGATILMVTHSDHDASFSDKTIFMRDGMIFSQKENLKDYDVLINAKADKKTEE